MHCRVTEEMVRNRQPTEYDYFDEYQTKKAKTKRLKLFSPGKNKLKNRKKDGGEVSKLMST